MANVSVKENSLRFGGVNYFRGKAENVVLGSIGKKRTPVAGQNYLEAKSKIKSSKFSKVKATVVEIDFKKSLKRDFKTSIEAIIKGVPVKVTGGATFDRLKSGELKLVKFIVTHNNMKKAANNSRRRLQDLIYWGSRARIAHEIFVVMDAELANSYSNTANIKISAGVKGMKVSADDRVAGKGKTNVTLSKGTTFAYLLAKIEWNAKKKKNRTKIMDLRDDPHGI